MTVPVWLSSTNNPGVEKLLYTVLDSESDACFVDQELCTSLQPETFPVRLKLTTMARDAIVHSRKPANLEVRGYNFTVLIDLPPAYTKDHIPINRKHIPTCKTARKWSHLAVIAATVRNPTRTRE